MSNKISVFAVILSIASIIISIGVMFKCSMGNKYIDRQYVMYIGTNDKDTYKPEISTDEAKNIVDEICLKYFDGYTIQDAVGSWKDETGTSTHENTIVCYFDNADKQTVYAVANEVIKKLNQNTVLIEADNIKMEYYSGKR